MFERLPGCPLQDLHAVALSLSICARQERQKRDEDAVISMESGVRVFPEHLKVQYKFLSGLPLRLMLKLSLSGVSCVATGDPVVDEAPGKYAEGLWAAEDDEKPDDPGDEEPEELDVA